MDMDTNNLHEKKDILIITIAIQMHGMVISLELDDMTSSIFENVRMLCKAGGLKIYETGNNEVPSIIEEMFLVSHLRDIFGKDMDRSTYDIINDARSGLFIGNITFDKLLMTTDYEDTYNYLQHFADYVQGLFQGIFLLSIHRGRKLIYPINPHEKAINFLNIEDLHKLSYIFGTSVPNLTENNRPLPDQKIFINKENEINLNITLSENEKKRKIKEIRQEFMDLLGGWKLTIDRSGNIQIIKLSYLVNLIKEIIGESCIINLLDYSCNAPTKYIEEQEKRSAKYIMPIDIEQGLPGERYGGKKRKKKTEKIRKRKKRNKRKKTKMLKENKKVFYL